VTFEIEGKNDNSNEEKRNLERKKTGYVLDMDFKKIDKNNKQASVALQRE
jgi:hypothetical protein